MFLRFLASSHALGLVHQCRWDDAAAEAEEVLAAPLGAPLSRIFALVALALVRARRGEPGAHTLLAEAVTYGHPTDFVRLAPVWEAMAEVAWLDGDDTAAAGIARRGLAAARDGREPWTAGFLARWVDIAGGKREEGDDWASAAQRWTEIGSPYDAALARLGGDVDAMTDALETFSKLGARPAATRARAKLKAAGFRLGVRGPRGATRTNRHGLTAREQDVIGLLREGLTGPQIAGRLHISPKTVARHTEAIFTKLGAHTRAEALRRYEA
ncbi:helix-turn-helix transcriptional regulator [Pseudonocardia sp. TRM90224]|uniref:helix-turn-helix transcriptional regulator n=1 Tax=Pseudonocardia sp. TRM90224 TaxID=2812678 RepID=UPI001E34BF9F|nr:helix-turn-helix transcriptional regulator [Pseudonocardia sp. TRM90224]